MSQDQQQFEHAIAAFEAQRPLLGDAMVDMAVAPLKAKLAALRGTTAKPEPAQALKQVSILFLDVVGSTTLAQQLDPEEISAVMDGALSRGTAIVEAHRGRVLQYAGDNILAAFGADEAAEDDPENAVRCGLALLALGQTLGSEVQAAHGYTGMDVRVGIHTGGVLLGGGLDEDGAIRGQAVNIAARMEQAAPAGGLRITHDTYSQVRGLFDVSAPEPLAVKGIAEPVVSYLVAKAMPRSFRVASRGIEGVATRMIGRDAEFEALQTSFERLFLQAHFQATSVVADAGLGKSRLLDEFQAWTEDRPESVCLFRGRATPQTRGQPFGLLRDIVAWRLQLSDDDTLSQAKAKIEAGLMPLFADEPEFAQGHAHLLGHLIGLDWKDSPHLRGILDDPRQIRNRAQHAAAQMLRRVGAHDGSPVILLLEDLHWADDESLDFLTYLAEVNRDMPLWLLAFTRPTLFERREDWGDSEAATRSRHERIDLHPLDKRASRDLAHELLKKLPEVPAALRELITGGAEGNPFYMEELVRMLIDQGVIDTRGERWRLNAERLLTTEVPSTLTGVLQARLDGLPAEERLALQAASVIGQVFWDRALLALYAQASTALPKLVQRELALLRPDAADTLPDGLREYAFKHTILHQVTYGTVLRRHKKKLHAKLADWLAAQSQGDNARAGEFLGLTALHYTEAGEEAHAAEFHARAAEHAATRMSHGAVLHHVKHALALLDGAHNPPTSRQGDPAAPAQAQLKTQALLRWRLLSVREQGLDFQGEREPQGADIDALDSLAEMLDEDTRRADSAYRRGFRASRMADWALCKASARRAVAMCDRELARRTQSSGLQGDSVALHRQRLLSLRLVGLASYWQSQLDEAETLLIQTLDEARVRGLLKPQSLCLHSLAMLDGQRGKTVLAHERQCQALEIARQAGDRRTEASALVNVGMGWMVLGHLTAARRDLEEGLRLIRQNGDRSAECGALFALSIVARWRGDDARGLALAHSALDIAVAVQSRDFEARASFILGEAEAALGRLEPATHAYRRALAVALETAHHVRFNASAALAQLALVQGDVTGALQQVEALLNEAGHGAQTNADDACDAAAPGLAASAVFDGALIPRLIELTLHRVFAAASDPRAAVWLQRAHRKVMAQAGDITDPALREMFLTNVPFHRDIVALWEAHGAR